MQGPHAFLVALTVVLGVAAVTTVLFQRLRQPVVLGYILAGLIVGPHVPIPLVADVGIVQTLSELGVILLMFALGLEFSVGKLVAVGPAAGVTALVQCSIMLWLGFVTGRLFGWTTWRASSPGRSSPSPAPRSSPRRSTSRRSRAAPRARGRRPDRRGPHRHPAHGGAHRLRPRRGLSGERARRSRSGGWRSSSGRSSGSGMLVVPRAVRWIRHLERPETTLVACLGLCFGVALLAHESGTRWRSARSSRARSSPSPGSSARRAPGRARARHVRRDLLRLGRHADRPGGHRPPRGRGRRLHGVVIVGKVVERRRSAPS